MTFQEAQTRFSTITGNITTATSPAELLQKQQALIALQNSLPSSAEFDAIADAIAEFSPKLTGAIVQGDLAALQGREAGLKAAASLLTQVEARANADARVLTFEKPKMVLAALNETVTTLQELRTAAKNGDYVLAAAKIDALATLVQQVRGSIKAN